MSSNFENINVGRISKVTLKELNQRKLLNVDDRIDENLSKLFLSRRVEKPATKNDLLKIIFKHIKKKISAGLDDYNDFHDYVKKFVTDNSNPSDKLDISNDAQGKNILKGTEKYLLEKKNTLIHIDLVLLLANREGEILRVDTTNIVSGKVGKPIAVRILVTDDNEYHYLLPLSPTEIIWKQEYKMDLPGRCPFLCKSDGKISYGEGDRILTCDWENRRYDHPLYLFCSFDPVESITALAEQNNGYLIVGDCKARLFIQKGEDKWSRIDFAENYIVNKIIVVDAQFCVVEFQNGNFYVVDFKDLTIKSSYNYCLTKYCFFKDGSIALSAPPSVQFSSFVGVLDCSTQAERRCFLNRPCLALKSCSGYLCAIQEKIVTIWNPEENSKKTLEYDVPNPSPGFYLTDEDYIFLPPDTLIVPNKFSLKKFSLTDEKINFRQPKRGIITALVNLTKLVDDYNIIMYATASSPSALHVVTMEGRLLFSDESITDDGDIYNLTELSDGTVVMASYNIDTTLIFIRPYSTYYSNLKVIKQMTNNKNTWYKARRAYEKAKKAAPDNEKPMMLILDKLKNLETTSYLKHFKNRIHLDLLKISDSEFNDKSSINKNKRCKKRLFVGEGDFSYTEAIIKKHEETHICLAEAITATELQRIQSNDLVSVERPFTPKYGIDATKIHEHFQGQRFKRIHWNCPYGMSFGEEFKHTMIDFFWSSSLIQEYGDKIHVTLLNDDIERRQTENPIVLASVKAGYGLIRKRYFGERRYPGYRHTMTKGDSYHKDNKREYVFEKIDCSLLPQETGIQRAQSLRSLEKKNYKLQQSYVSNRPDLIEAKRPLPGLGSYYFECSTDEDSSDYYDSSSDSEIEIDYDSREKKLEKEVS